MIRETRNGSACIVTTWEIRILDEHGDAIDVWVYDSKVEGDAGWFIATRQLIGSVAAKAVVLEKHIERSPAHLFDEPNTFRKLRWAGSEKALKAGGWLDE